VYRGLAHGLDETTAGHYSEDPGESVQKTTWDYWDAKHEVNLAVERWADGRVECYHGRRIDPDRIVIAGAGDGGGGLAGMASALAGGGPVARVASAFGSGTPVAGTLSALGLSAVLGVIAMIPAVVLGATIETTLTVACAVALLVALFASLRGSDRVGSWIVGSIVLGPLFAGWPPLTSIVGLAVLLLLPAGLTRWIAMGERGESAAPARGAFVAVAAATLAAGLYNYYRFAPFPRSFGQYVLAVGPAPLAGMVAAVVAWLVLRASGTR
jgi:hypothetical protein